MAVGDLVRRIVKRQRAHLPGEERGVSAAVEDAKALTNGPDRATLR